MAKQNIKETGSAKPHKPLVDVLKTLGDQQFGRLPKNLAVIETQATNMLAAGDFEGLKELLPILDSAHKRLNYNQWAQDAIDSAQRQGLFEQTRATKLRPEKKIKKEKASSSKKEHKKRGRKPKEEQGESKATKKSEKKSGGDPTKIGPLEKVAFHTAVTQSLHEGRFEALKVLYPELAADKRYNDPSLAAKRIFYPSSKRAFKVIELVLTNAFGLKINKPLPSPDQITEQALNLPFYVNPKTIEFIKMLAATEQLQSKTVGEIIESAKPGSRGKGKKKLN